MSAATILVSRDSPVRGDVVALLEQHLSDMYATSPAESVHALDPTALARTEVTFVTARHGCGRLLGCGALKELDRAHGELKSMRTAPDARVSLETGTQEYFAPARRLYARHGFVECPPFGAYTLDPHSVFYTRAAPDPHDGAHPAP